MKDVIEVMKAFFANPYAYGNEICDEIISGVTDHFSATINPKTQIVEMAHGSKRENIDVPDSTGIFRNLCPRFAVRYAKQIGGEMGPPPLYGFQAILFFEPLETQYYIHINNDRRYILRIEITSLI